MPTQVILYDTTLRDGTQGDQVTLSAEDKLRIVQKLDDTGIHYIEGGWPGSNPKDARFFEMAGKINLKNSRLTAFGSTRLCKSSPEKDRNVQALLETEVETLTIFGKSWDLHASQILGVALSENLDMIYETVDYLKKAGRRVIYDAEHFFDGYGNNPSYAIKTLKAAEEAGADYIVLCDTNGGSMPRDIKKILEDVMPILEVPTGIHTHDDCGLALANSIAAVESGVKMVQGTINGYGERCGNVDLLSVIGNLQLKMDCLCLPGERLKQLTELSRFVSEIANIPPVNQRPFVGKSAFAHKGGGPCQRHPEKRGSL